MCAGTKAMRRFAISPCFSGIQAPRMQLTHLRCSNVEYGRAGPHANSEHKCAADRDA